MANVDKELTNVEPIKSTAECPLCRALGDREPNEVTLAAMREIEQGQGTVLHVTIEELMADLDSDDSGD